MVKAASALLGGAAIGAVAQSQPAAADVPPGSVTLESFHDEAKDPAPNEAGARTLGTGPNQAAPGDALADKAARSGDTFTGPVTVDPPGNGISTISATGLIHHPTDTNGPAAALGSLWGTPVLGLGNSILMSPASGVLRPLNPGTPEHPDDLPTKGYVDSRWVNRLHVNIKDDYGAQGDGVTDDSPAFEAAFADLAVTHTTTGHPQGVSGAYLIVPPGNYTLRSTVHIHRFAGVIQGAGAGMGPVPMGILTTGLGSVLQWDGPQGEPMFTITDSRNISFRDLRFFGHDSKTPKAALSFKKVLGQNQGTNAQISVLDCVFGYWPWSSSVNQGLLNTCIEFTGHNSDNDQFHIHRSTFNGSRSRQTTAFRIENTQSVWGSLYDCLFNGHGIGFESAASCTLVNPQFNRCNVDIKILSTACINVFGFQSERSSCFADLDASSSLIVKGGGFQQSVDFMPPGSAMINAFPSSSRQTISLSDVTFTGTVPSPPPVIRFGPPGSTWAGGAGFYVRLDNCIGIDSTRAELVQPLTGSTSYGTVEWHSRWGGTRQFRNELRGTGAPGTRTALDINAWDPPVPGSA